MNHAHSQHAPESDRFWGSRYSIGFIALGAVAAYFLLTEHRAHFLGALPFLLLLACPLMHVFMHGGHGHKSRASRQPDSVAPSGPVNVEDVP